MPAAAAGLSGTTYSTTNPKPLARPSCSLTTLGTGDVSTPRNIVGTFGALSWRWGGAGIPGWGAEGGDGGAGGVCANPAIGRKAMAAMVVIGFIFMVLFLVKSLARDRDEHDFFTGIRDAE